MRPIKSNSFSTSSMYLVGENFTELIKLKITLQQIGDPELKVAQSEMKQNNQYFEAATGQPERFPCILIEGDVNAGCICDETPIIESFEPKSLRAGTDDILTIRGTCFGDSSAFSRVQFTNSKTGPVPQQWVQAHSNKVIAWNDTLIKLTVPSRTKLIPSDWSITHSAGTGLFRINKDCGPLSIGTSNEPLEIRFSAFNHKALIPNTFIVSDEPVYLANYNGFGGQSIAYGSSFKSYPGATDAFERALVTWRCATGINYIVKNDSDVDPAVAGIVGFGDLPAGVSGATINTTVPGTDFVPCDSLGVKVGANRSQFLIYFNKDISWYTDTLRPKLDIVLPIDTADLESTALHELGHAHILNHSNDSTDLMFYRKPHMVEYRREISPYSLEGGLYIMDISANSASDSCHTKMDVVTEHCEIITDLIEINDSAEKAEINIFPNPINDVLNVSITSLNGNSNLDLDWILYDINGRKKSSGTLQEFTVIDMEKMSSGIYFLSIHTNGSFEKSFKIIKQ